MDKQGLVLNGIGKQFYGITVLSDIDFEILPGEIHGLLGEKWSRKVNFDEDYQWSAYTYNW